MGLDNRDYIRQPQGQGFLGGGGTWPPVIKGLLAINIAVFLFQLFTTGPAGQTSPVTEWLSVSLDTVLKGQVWRLLTSAFCHSTSQFFHIVFNMLLLVVFGRELERRYGSREFLAFYLVAAVFASLAYLLLDLVTGSIRPAIGASGAVMGVLVLFACNNPKQEIILWFVLRMQVRWLVLGLLVMDLVPALGALAGKDFENNIANAAHLGGMLFGFLYWKLKMRLAPILNKIIPEGTGSSGAGKGKGAKEKKISGLTITGRSKAEIDKQVDELLQKISDKGFQSLSEKEKTFLQKASDKFGKR